MTQRLMELNFVLREEVIGGLPWKHGFLKQQSLGDMDRTLNIFLVKDAYAWINSMKANPFHAPHMERINWAPFLTKEWYSVLDSLGEVDRNPSNYQRFANIMQLRAAKLRDWIKVRDCLPYHYTLRYEDLIKNTTRVILDIARQFQPYGLRLRHLEPVTDVCVVHYGQCSTDSNRALRNQKIDYYLERKYITDTPETAQKFIRQNIDYETEFQLGYTYPSMKFSYL